MNASLPDFWFRDPWYFLAALIVLLIPGWAVQSWLRQDGAAEAEVPKRDLISWLADTVAISIAVTALLGLWLWVARIRVTGAVTVALYVLCLLAILAALPKRDLRVPGRAELLAGLRNGLLALLLAGILTAWRFYQARDLALPAWVDSVHHTLLVRLILEGGGLPRDFLPYLPAPAYYHYGFHLVAALHAFWAGIAPDRAVLWFGQLLNAGVAFSVYRVAYAFRAAQADESDGFRVPPWLPALIAAMLVGFAFQMPAYYISWGRYTMLAGLILLGPAIAAVFELREHPGQQGAGIRLALLVGGMCAVHYFALMLVGLFVAVQIFFGLSQAVRSRSFGILMRLGGWSLLGLVLGMPWLVWVFEHTQRQMRLELPLITDQAEGAQQRMTALINYTVYLMGPRHNYFLLGFSGAGLLAGLRKITLRPLVLWTVLVGLLSMPWALRFGPFRPDHYSIVLFFPAAILLAELLVQSVGALMRVLHPPDLLAQEAALALLLLVVGGLLVWGRRETRYVANPATIIATQADVQALDWINANTPQTARFFMNTARWQSVWRGVDGAYWLMPYTGRFGLVPPTFYSWGQPEYRTQIAGWAERAESVEGCTSAFWEVVNEAGLTHVYLREGVGRLQPAALQACPNLQLIYQVDGVFMYQISR